MSFTGCTKRGQSLSAITRTADFPAGRTVVGIAPQHYTDAALSAKVSAAGRYNARLQIIGFEYGEARTFMFLPRENKLVIHCKLLDAGRL
jgi:hypothetical protein